MPNVVRGAEEKVRSSAIMKIWTLKRHEYVDLPGIFKTKIKNQVKILTSGPYIPQRFQAN